MKKSDGVVRVFTPLHRAKKMLQRVLSALRKPGGVTGRTPLDHHRKLRILQQKDRTPSDTFVVVETFQREMEALIVKARLDAEGIESFIPDENMGRIYPGVVGVRLLVREGDAERVKQILREARSRDKGPRPPYYLSVPHVPE